jgi:hypothetical protein
MGYTILYYYNTPMHVRKKQDDKTPSGLISFSYMPHVKQAMRMSNINMRLPIIRHKRNNHRRKKNKKDCVELLLFMGPNLPLGL